MRIRALALVGLAALGTALAGSTASAGGTPVSFSITADPSSVEVGKPFEVSASGTSIDCTFGLTDELTEPQVQALEEAVTLTIRLIVPEVGTTQILGTIPAGEPGADSTGTFTAPTEPGTYEIGGSYESECSQGLRTDTTTLIVTAAPPPPASTEAPTTTPAPTTTSTIAGQVAPTTAATTTTTTTVAPVTLPATGRSTDGLVWIALVTALLGGGLVAVAARRS